MYIGPVIFALAPLLNTLISLLWHPTKGVFTLDWKGRRAGNFTWAFC